MNDGGPAFPDHFFSDGAGRISGPVDSSGQTAYLDVKCGMSLRAYFAGQALNGWAAGRNAPFDGCKGLSSAPDYVAAGCVRYADALIAELQKESA